MSSLNILWRFFILLLVTSLITPAVSARAQSAAYVTISTPDTTQFPLINIYLDAFADQGNFITNLSPAEIAVIEDGQQITPDKVENQKPPLSLVLAINADPALAVRDGFGESRYDKIVAALDQWTTARPADSQDKLALTWNGGVVASRLSPAGLKSRLDSFDPALRTSTAGLSALAFALDAAQEAELAPGVKKAILLVTPHLGVKDQQGLNDLLTRAKQSGVRIYVWITDSSDFQENPGALALQDLALATDGNYATFTGSETLPNPEDWLAPLRNIYLVSYTSEVRTGGQHSLALQVNKAELTLTSQSLSFPLEVKPPSPALLSPPIQIVRQNPESPFDVESFFPRQMEISALIEFPDGWRRPLTRTTLYVDGQKAAENTTEPFNSFNWDLSGYVVSAEHLLQVEAEDTLGLISLSAEVPVQVTVIEPPGGAAGLILRNRFAITIVLMVLAGALVLGIIVLGGRKSLARLAERRKNQAAQLDPVTQPVHEATRQAQARANPFPWLRRKAEPPPAYLVRLAADGSPTPGDPIAISGSELTFGVDPTQATHILDHACISGLHARLKRDDADHFILTDQNSVAGTWVNYAEISKEGCSLHHGDVVNFGTLTYRFVLTKPPANPKANITHLADQ